MKICYDVMREAWCVKTPFTHHASRITILFLLFFGTGCAELFATTTREPLFILPTAEPINLETPSVVITDDLGNLQIIEKPTATPTLTPTPFETRENAGIRPAQALSVSAITATPVPIEWRPPPYNVPLSIHPDDHYWLMRPLPSGSRNYDLEWYPYGNDVFIPELAPYRIHHGLDFPNDAGTPIVAAADGTVVWAGARPSPRNGVNYYGNTIIIQHDWQWLGKDVFTLYAHTLEMFVKEGDHVRAGDLIAGVGASGEVSGSHLHLEVRVGTNSYADVRNPMLWLAPYEGWGTLAGRFVDRTGRPVEGADISLFDVEGVHGIRRTKTYFGGVVNSDEVWQENFVLADVPPGRYTVVIRFEGQVHRRTIDILPGRTNFMVMDADIRFVPTITPIPSPTPYPTSEWQPTATPVWVNNGGQNANSNWSTPVQSAAQTGGPLDFTYDISWSPSSEKEGDMIATVRIRATGGTGNYVYFHDGLRQTGASFNYAWGRCRANPGSFTVESGGESKTIEYYLESPCS